MQRAARSTPSTLKQKLSRGDIVTGMQSFSAHPALIEAMGTAGMDFVTVDMEHCPTGIADVVHAVRAAETGGITPFVRIPHMDGSLLGRVLDLGAKGVVIPHASLEICRAAVSAGKYAPRGNRGACPIVRSAGYAPASWATFAEDANDQTMIIPLLEDAAAVDELEDMLALPGVDVIFVGPWDLSISLGVPASNYDHPKLAAVLERAVAAAKKKGKHIMTTVGATIDTQYAGRLVSKGVSLLSFSADIMVFLDACRKIAAVGSDVSKPRAGAA